MAQENVGAFMQKMRREKGMTQKELADILHISDKTISKWETGKGIPDVSYLENICTALDVTINELLSGQKLPPEEYPPKSRGQYALSFAGKSRDQKAKQNVSAPGRHFIGLGRGWTFSGIGIQYDMVS